MAFSEGDSDIEGKSMKEIVIAGAGKIGSTIALMLAGSGDYRVILADRDAAQLDAAEKHPAIETVTVDIADGETLRALLKGRFAVLSAAPFQLTTTIAEAA